MEMLPLEVGDTEGEGGVLGVAVELREKDWLAAQDTFEAPTRIAGRPTRGSAPPITVDLFHSNAPTATP